MLRSGGFVFLHLEFGAKLQTFRLHFVICILHTAFAFELQVFRLHFVICSF